MSVSMTLKCTSALWRERYGTLLKPCLIQQTQGMWQSTAQVVSYSSFGKCFLSCIHKDRAAVSERGMRGSAAHLFWQLLPQVKTVAVLGEGHMASCTPLLQEARAWNYHMHWDLFSAMEAQGPCKLHSIWGSDFRKQRVILVKPPSLGSSEVGKSHRSAVSRHRKLSHGCAQGRVILFRLQSYRTRITNGALYPYTFREYGPRYLQLWIPTFITKRGNTNPVGLFL